MKQRMNTYLYVYFLRSTPCFVFWLNCYVAKRECEQLWRPWEKPTTSQSERREDMAWKNIKSRKMCFMFWREGSERGKKEYEIMLAASVFFLLEHPPFSLQRQGRRSNRSTPSLPTFCSSLSLFLSLFLLLYLYISLSLSLFMVFVFFDPFSQF